MNQSDNLQKIIDKFKAENSDADEEIKKDLMWHKKAVDKNIANIIFNTDRLFDTYERLENKSVRKAAPALSKLNQKARGYQRKKMQKHKKDKGRHRF